LAGRGTRLLAVDERTLREQEEDRKGEGGRRVGGESLCVNKITTQLQRNNGALERRGGSQTG